MQKPRHFYSEVPMTKLFRNDSPEALTRHQAVALEKRRMKERARQARELAAQGRGEDTEIAHVALGELVIPAALQSPEVLNVLRRAAASQNIPFDRLRVGSRRNSINPTTGMAEFGSELDLWGYGYDPFDPPDGIPGIDVVVPRWDWGGSFFDSINFGNGERPGGGASAPQQPYVVPGPPTEEVIARASRGPSLAPISPKPANRLRDATNPPYSGGDYLARAEDALPGGDLRLPGGDTVSDNLERTRRDLEMGRRGGLAGTPAGSAMGSLFGTAGAIGQWVNRVWPRHAWDYKQQTRGYDFPGNYNYGATGSALLPENVLLRGAGAAQMFLQPGYDPKNGVPWGSWPYGDDPIDSADISAGYAYGKSAPRK